MMSTDIGGRCLASDQVRIVQEVSNGRVSIDPKGLILTFYRHNGLEQTPITTFSKIFSEVQSVQTDHGITTVVYKNGITILIACRNDRVIFTIQPQTDRVIQWPKIQEAPSLMAYLIPEGEGIYVPVSDLRIRSHLAKEPLNHMHMMPFTGFLYSNMTMTILFTPYRMTALLDGSETGYRLSYDFRKRDQRPSYEVVLTFSKPDVLEPSRIFKTFLKEQKQYITLAEKERSNPNIARLAGAIHAYMWGDGRTKAALEALKAAGITKAWIGYEEKPTNIIPDPWSKPDYVTPDYIWHADALGYLVGAYDSYHTMQRSDQADSYGTNFGKDSYPKWCVRQKNQSIVAGFAGRGCAVSMTALAQTQNQIVHQRLKSFQKNGVKSIFLDCHGMLEVYDDYDPLHPQTIWDDIKIRLEHLRLISAFVVLGSEAATADTVPHLAFSHGNFCTLYALFYPRMHLKHVYGGWWPNNRPAIFFKSIRADAQDALRYAPSYRLPMLQAVFHECMVTTDRWDAPITKWPALLQDRLLLEWLYGVPSMWSLDLKSIKKYSNVLKKIGKVVTPLHAKMMHHELIAFSYLTADRMVQKVVYAHKTKGTVVMIGNFRSQPFAGIPAKSIQVQDGSTQPPMVLTPSASILE